MNLRPEKGDYINIHTHHTGFQDSVFSIVNVFLSDYPEVPAKTPFSIGLHPWHLGLESDAGTRSKLQKATSLPNVMAIGESGLDKAIKASPELQEERFRIHIDISEEHKKPLIIHCVKAFNEIMSLKTKLKPSSPWIIHGYQGSEQLTRDLIRDGFYVSVNERIMKYPERNKSMLQEVPVNRLFLETDEYETHISGLYGFVAECYGMELQNLKDTVMENFNSVWNMD